MTEKPPAYLNKKTNYVGLNILISNPCKCKYNGKYLCSKLGYLCQIVCDICHEWIQRGGGGGGGGGVWVLKW